MKEIFCEGIVPAFRSFQKTPNNIPGAARRDRLQFTLNSQTQQFPNILDTMLFTLCANSQFEFNLLSENDVPSLE